MSSGVLRSADVSELEIVEAQSSWVELQLSSVAINCQEQKKNKLQILLSATSLRTGRKCNTHMRGDEVLNRVVPHGI